MFNTKLKKEALKIHKYTVDKYNKSYEAMTAQCEELYKIRENSVKLITDITQVINSIANTSKSFETQFGSVGDELAEFKKTEQYAAEAYKASVKAGRNIVEGAAAGIGIAALAPNVLMSIATTFGTASTGTAISALSGAAAQKAAVAWIGRTFASFAIKKGAGIAVGKTVLALAGPIGWSVTALTISGAAVSLSRKNKKFADSATEEAKCIEKAREGLDESTCTIKALKEKTILLFNDIDKQKERIISFTNSDYESLDDDNRYFLGTVVNNTLSLSALLNETVE